MDGRKWRFPECGDDRKIGVRLYVPHNFKPGSSRGTNYLEQMPCVFLFLVVCSIGASFASAYSIWMIDRLPSHRVSP